MDKDHGFRESMSNSSGTGVFDCNICFNLAQNPIVTPCGHLFCWPCLYKWLQFHSNSHECPVCKSLIKEDNLVPIYGRGTSSSLLMDNIPSRPTSRRPQTPQAPDLTYFGQDGSGAPRLEDLTRTARLGAISSLLDFRVSDSNDVNGYGASTGVPYLFSSYAHGGYAHGFHHYSIHVEGTKFVFLKMCFLFLCFIGVLMLILCFLFWS